MYPGNLECEALKKSTGTSNQISKNSCHESSSLENAFLPSDQTSRRRSAIAATAHTVHGIRLSRSTGR